MANLQLPINQDHEVLGSEYCAGYLDTLQKWNNGFYCPASDESQDVFCCGTDSHKYCCTKKDQVVQAEVENFTVLVGIIVGASAALLILTLVSCFCCSCCLLYKKQNPHSASLYHLHTTSEHSGVSNMYSLSNAASRSATPLPLGTMGLSQSVVPPGGGILVGGPNHHASQHHLHSSQLLIDSSIDPHNEFHMNVLNGRGGAGLSLSHSQTLPHNLSHHGKGISQGDPDLISHHGQQVMYNTLGRNPMTISQHPDSLAYQADIKAGGFIANQDLASVPYNRNPEAFVVNSISQDVSTMSRLAYQPNHMIFPHHQQQQQQQLSLLDEQDDKQLFHSTKF